MGWGKKISIRYLGCFLALSGCQANVPTAAGEPFLHFAIRNRISSNTITTAFQANNICSHSKRAVGSALLVGWGGVGGIVASLICSSRYPSISSCSQLNQAITDRQVDYPDYVPGISGTMAFQVVIIAICTGLTFYSKRMNRLADEGKVVLEGTPGFRYTI